jgi:hypothetical protein
VKRRTFALLKFTPKPAPLLTPEEQYLLDCYRRVRAASDGEQFLRCVGVLADIQAPVKVIQQ